MTMYPVKHMAMRMVCESTVELPFDVVETPYQAAAVACHMIGDRPVEFMVAILLNGAGRISGVVTIAQGGAHGVGVKPSDVLRPVLAAQAMAFVLVHNHPSGDPKPSPQDVEFTAAIKAAADVVGVPMVDHVVVVADGSYRSV